MKQLFIIRLKYIICQIYMSNNMDYIILIQRVCFCVCSLYCGIDLNVLCMSLWVLWVASSSWDRLCLSVGHCTFYLFLVLQ